MEPALTSTTLRPTTTHLPPVWIQPPRLRRSERSSPRRRRKVQQKQRSVCLSSVCSFLAPTSLLLLLLLHAARAWELIRALLIECATSVNKAENGAHLCYFPPPGVDSRYCSDPSCLQQPLYPLTPPQQGTLRIEPFPVLPLTCILFVTSWQHHHLLRRGQHVPRLQQEGVFR